MDHKRKMDLIRLTMKEAEKAVAEGNAPYGAVLTDRNGNVVAKAHNTQRSSCDPTAHGEINLLRKASKVLKTKDLKGYCIFSNTESCSMCMSACIKAGIVDFYFGSFYDRTIMSSDPDLTVFEIAERAKSKLSIETNILRDECLAQIKRGNELLK
jgi:tRNA(Arg) A34 adenosine deaminase TadA